jgi:HEPN domain-containing protein
VNTQEKFEYWFDIAKYDLESAYGNFQIGRWLYVIFACQQALEKLLKGLYIILIDDNVPFIHNIGILLKKLNQRYLVQLVKKHINFVTIFLDTILLVAILIINEN